MPWELFFNPVKTDFLKCQIEKDRVFSLLIRGRKFSHRDSLTEVPLRKFYLVFSLGSSLTEKGGAFETSIILTRSYVLFTQTAAHE